MFAKYSVQYLCWRVPDVTGVMLGMCSDRYHVVAPSTRLPHCLVASNHYPLLSARRGIGQAPSQPSSASGFDDIVSNMLSNFTFAFVSVLTLTLFLSPRPNFLFSLTPVTFRQDNYSFFSPLLNQFVAAQPVPSSSCTSLVRVLDSKWSCLCLPTIKFDRFLYFATVYFLPTS